jgi:hypothetical protein
VTLRAGSNAAGLLHRLRHQRHHALAPLAETVAR